MRAAAVLLTLLVLAGCSGAVQVDPPVPQGEAVAACDTLATKLPRTLDGAQRAATTPESPYVAVWGEAEIALRCGVPRPVKMAPTDQLTEINGVGWYPDPDKPTLFTAILDTAYVEVLVAPSHTAANVLVDLSEALASVAKPAG